MQKKPLIFRPNMAKNSPLYTNVKTKTKAKITITDPHSGRRFGKFPFINLYKSIAPTKL